MATSERYTELTGDTISLGFFKKYQLLSSKYKIRTGIAIAVGVVITIAAALFLLKVMSFAAAATIGYTLLSVGLVIIVGAVIEHLVRIKGVKKVSINQDDIELMTMPPIHQSSTLSDMDTIKQQVLNVVSPETFNAAVSTYRREFIASKSDIREKEDLTKELKESKSVIRPIDTILSDEEEIRQIARTRTQSFMESIGQGGLLQLGITSGNKTELSTSASAASHVGLLPAPKPQPQTNSSTINLSDPRLRAPSTTEEDDDEQQELLETLDLSGNRDTQSLWTQ